MENKINRVLIKFFSAFLIYEVLCYLNNAMIMPSMIDIINNLHAPESAIPNTVIVYMIAVSIVPLFIAPVVNFFGKSRLIAFGCLIFMISNLACPFANNLLEFNIFRFLQGAGQGFIFLGYTFIHETFDDVSSVKLTAMMANVTVFAPLIGPGLGSLIAIYLGWKSLFWLTGAVALIAFLGIITWTPIDHKQQINEGGIFVQLKKYLMIIKSTNFILAVLILLLAMIPSEMWMIFSIIIILTTLKFSLLSYNLCMVAIVLSFICSSVVLRIIIHRFTFSTLVKFGSIIFFMGSFFSILFNHSITIFVICLSVSVFGGGIFRGIIYRRLMTDVNNDKNAVSAIFNLCITIFLAGTIYLANIYFKSLNYSLLSFSIYSSIASFLCMIFAIYFITNSLRNSSIKSLVNDRN